MWLLTHRMLQTCRSGLQRLLFIQALTILDCKNCSDVVIEFCKTMYPAPVSDAHLFPRNPADKIDNSEWNFPARGMVTFSSDCSMLVIGLH
ncbi:uncharacterized protein BDZ99DRAFT_232768 [Mytilinidion resinicola]|uniref:Uncharacterized protein n=1 Tax=Mytilinidion resinicola TaxID=574789 RepID=A0A6A6Z1X1_9PEZI|nr:uncharacterized protein BDZ99DRAFT_232768 [Mytilinidion resinicola]KAF2814185.1 hypothetical protein BDZ99DRAFT_232768 [Mytilinidion resinicola]